MTVTIRVRPIDHWPREQTRNRVESPFLRPREQKASGGWTSAREREVPYSVTLDDLDRELYALRVKEAVLQLALTDRDIRIDGQLRADAWPRHPGVVLTFTAPRKGVLTFACDRFLHWQTNLRAIAKGLEALRLMDRYGITESGEQYVGWQELPSGAPMAERRDLVELSVSRRRASSSARSAARTTCRSTPAPRSRTPTTGATPTARRSSSSTPTRAATRRR